MTRAAEFCYIAVAITPAGRMSSKPYLAGYSEADRSWTNDPEQALRITEPGRAVIARALPGIGFRKILVG